MGIAAVDTNILIRQILNDHPELSPKAARILYSSKPGALVLDRLIIEETGYVLSSFYGFTKAQVGRVWQSFLAEESFQILDRELVAQAIELFITEKPLSFEDAWLLAFKRSGRATKVHTFDDKLKKLLAA